ncbi:hypothetical protein [Dyadobacter psychrotolerans]|uniref:Glycosyltransferase RgtA/B/C/D-like domain-containing protein n=1 Tax=Dyadobacter psychrotolerans TaxID=2541721 RepID=A0A4R5DKL3_9BACT|nr:hypothetical protein [Dyadobacter psychrotolerans]TDE12514.1 hypothetical protein E0F88_22750 [Dyadobacter psychrotolerans]
MIHFDNCPTVYWLIGYILAGIVMLSAFYKKVSLPIFVILSIALLTFMRLPVIVFNREINPDESQMLSHAITLFHNPVYWRSVDGTTIGPLDNYLLVVPRLFGFQIDYTSGRFMGLLCTVGTLLFLLLSLKNWFGSLTAQISVLIPLIFLSFTQEPDFVHYSSEQLPAFLLTLTLWFLSRYHLDKANSTTNSYLLGLTAGAVPFAKLQAVPQALLLVVAAFWFCYLIYKDKKSYRPALMLVFGGITFPALTFIWAACNHVLTDLIDFYLLGNVIYAGGSAKTPIVQQFFKILSLSTDFIIFTAVLILPAIFGLIQVFQKNIKGNLQISAIIIGLVLASVYAVTKSGNDFVHYLNFCIVPWSLLAAFGIQRLNKWAIVFPGLLLLYFCFSDYSSFKNQHQLNSFISDNATTLAESPVVKELKKYTKKDDFMVVWGWQCMYYVEAQLAEGTAENHSERSIYQHDMLGKYRSRYISNIQRTKPVVFLDAVGKNSFWVQDRKTQGFENFPALAEYISSNYNFKGTFDDTRLFVRKDR